MNCLLCEGKASTLGLCHEHLAHLSAAAKRFLEAIGDRAPDGIVPYDWWKLRDAVNARYPPPQIGITKALWFVGRVWMATRETPPASKVTLEDVRAHEARGALWRVIPTAGVPPFVVLCVDGKRIRVNNGELLQDFLEGNGLAGCRLVPVDRNGDRL